MTRRLCDSGCLSALGVALVVLGAISAIVFFVRDESGQIVERYIARLAVLGGGRAADVPHNGPSDRIVRGAVAAAVVRGRAARHRTVRRRFLLDAYQQLLLRGMFVVP